MKRFFYFVWIIISLSALVLSCSKVGSATDEGDPNEIDQNDGVFPPITVLKPSPNQVYKSGDLIVVEGKVTDDKKMYKGKVQIKNDANDFVMAETYYETHFLLEMNYRLAYKADVTSPTDFSILIEFQDHGSNTSTATMKVKVNL
ncbi:MAG TPA: hypothetical protein VFH08_11325 [Chitinophagaceae bacterium]|nr:hypothetical protein [Chitinophagaceae bacterium]